MSVRSVEERLPSEQSVPKLYFMCVLCMPCSAVCLCLGGCLISVLPTHLRRQTDSPVQRSRLWQTHKYGLRETAANSICFPSRNLQTTFPCHHTERDYEFPSSFPPSPWLCLPAACIRWYVIRVLYQASICQKRFPESVCIIYVNICRCAAGCCVVMCFCIKWTIGIQEPVGLTTIWLWFFIYKFIRII